MTRERLALPGLAIAAALAIAGAAQADAVGAQSPIPATPEKIAISVPPAALGLSEAQAEVLRNAGVVRTAIDHQFGSDTAVGSIGFLCGRQPAYLHSGAAEAHGYDPDGKFVGAKLAFAFK